MSELDRPRLALYVALGLVVCVLGARYLGAHAGAGGAPARDAVASAPRAAGAVSEGDDAAAGAASVRVDRADGGRVTVHVAGAVRRPGLYRLPAGSRVDDALRRAGGPGRRADMTAVNLATKLEDGRQVLVPERTAPATAAKRSAPAPVAAAGQDAPVNLNTATLAQLDTLDGVGPGIAQRILDYREQHGAFGRIEELGEVPGIGAKRLAALTPQVVL